MEQRVAGAGLVGFSPWIMAILLGLGNALFHVGGGSISLDLTPYRASAPGIFVAPGAFGLVVGTMAGRSGSFNPLIAIAALVLICAILIKLDPERGEEGEKLSWSDNRSKAGLALALILFVIAGRALVGFSFAFPWKQDVLLGIILAAAVAAGKGVGGILADRFGFTEIALIGLIISVPFFMLGANMAAIAITGVFLFQFTMPVTLAAVYRIFPNRPGFAFGLPCLFLLIGTLPALLKFQTFFNSVPVILLIIALMALAVLFSLKVFTKNQI
jgi:FSR family fosmidomycin resistance protein-like MFS transporter